MIYKVEFHAMGSSIQVLLEGEESVNPILREVPNWFEYWETILSRFRPESELSRLNRMTGEAVVVSAVLWDVLQNALRMENESDGLVTPGLLDALNSAGYDRSFELLDGKSFSGQPTNQPSESLIGQIMMNEKQRSVLLPPGIHLDFGGIGKGWAAQQTAAILGKLGPVLVDAGGDIVLRGDLSDGSQWTVGVEDPFHTEDEISQIELTDMGVATSGKNRRHWLKSNIMQHHIIDPRTGSPSAGDVYSATVIGSNVIKAEMAAKVLVILGSENGSDWLKERPDLDALLVTTSGEVLRSPGFSKFERVMQ